MKQTRLPAMTMTMDAPEPEVADRRTVLSCDESGNWTVRGPNREVRRFADFDAALDSARHAPETLVSTIEVWQGGEYICCLPPEEGLHHVASIHVASPLPKGGRLARVERWANRAAEFLLTTASVLFWVSLMVVALAASLGWRLLLL
jgi:hypothetical protein